MSARRNASSDPPSEITYPLGAAVRLTGLSPALLRAWERRYGAVRPLRSPGGSRRYRASDVERLRLMKAAVDAGYRIGEVAGLDSAEIQRRADRPGARAAGAIEATLEALEALDAAEAERLVSLQLAALGPVRFAREFAAPCLEELGRAWAERRICVASEHLGSGLLRSLLGSALRSSTVSALAPPIVFATPDGERHELGLLIAALTALGAGGNPLYLGAELPLEEMLGAVEKVAAAALAIALVALPAAEARQAVRSLREQLPAEVELWVGGARALELELPESVVRFASADLLDARVAMLNERSRRP